MCGTLLFWFSLGLLVPSARDHLRGSARTRPSSVHVPPCQNCFFGSFVFCILSLKISSCRECGTLARGNGVEGRGTSD